MTKRNDGTRPFKSFRLIGGSDEAATRIARRIREQYGHIIPMERKIDPAIETEARASGISICWLRNQRLQVAKGPWTGTHGAVASC